MEVKSESKISSITVKHSITGNITYLIIEADVTILGKTTRTTITTKASTQVEDLVKLILQTLEIKEY